MWRDALGTIFADEDFAEALLARTAACAAAAAGEPHSVSQAFEARLLRPQPLRRGAFEYDIWNLDQSIG